MLNIVTVKPSQDPNYCIVKYSIGDRAGVLVRALRVFFVSIIIKSKMSYYVTLFI